MAHKKETKTERLTITVNREEKEFWKGLALFSEEHSSSDICRIVLNWGRNLMFEGFIKDDSINVLKLRDLDAWLSVFQRAHEGHYKVHDRLANVKILINEKMKGGSDE